MTEATVIVFLVCLILVVAGLIGTVVRLAVSLDRAREDNNELVRKMSDQVIANSDFQIERLKIEASRDVSNTYTQQVLAPRAAVAPHVNGVVPQDDADFTSQPR